VNRFLNYLEKGSIIVIDKARYCCVVMDKLPNKSTLRDKIMVWSAIPLKLSQSY
jgi:hypothetical protein